jgi:hypothetical protein
MGGHPSTWFFGLEAGRDVYSKFAYFVRAGERRGCKEVGPSDHCRRKMPNMYDSSVVQLSKKQPEALLPFDLLQAVPQHFPQVLEVHGFGQCLCHMIMLVF